MHLSNYKQYKQAEQYLESLSNLSRADFFAGNSDPDHHFKRAKHLFKLAGNPDKNLKIIHVAGTSGKGTVCNYIYNILRCAGFKVGAHFSPFVSVATEKVQINNQFISTKEFIILVEEIKPIIKKCYETYDAPSYFEVWLLIALLYFEKKKCDYVVWETGCGGRYDGTNAVLKTVCSIITSIGLDHTHILGNSIKKIAYEKAGIIRKAGTVFTSVKKPVALKVIKDVCQKQKAYLIVVRSSNKAGKIPAQDRNDKSAGENLAITIAVAEFLKVPVKAIDQGIKEARMPARFEIVSQKPLIILDGAHNADKIDFLVKKLKTKLLREPQHDTKQKVHLVCALTEPKKPAQVLKALIPLADKIYCTRFLMSHRKAVLPALIAKQIKKPSQVFLDPQKAFESAMKNAGPNDLILVTGSFFLCSVIRENWISEEWQLENRTNFKP